MNRSRRATSANSKAFVSGGVYNPNVAAKPLIQPPANALSQASPVSAPTPTPVPAPVAVKEVQAKKKDAPPSVSALPIPIFVKDEPVAMAEDESSPIESASEGFYIDISADNGNGGKIPFKKIFQKRKKSSERTRDKKQRQNRQLRKSMLPKNALMALNELKGVNISDFTINSNPDGGFTAILTVNSNQYHGKGLSKMAAKNLACEHALRDYIIAKMKPKPRKPKNIAVENQASTGPEPMDTNGSDTESPEDELPMLNLASFAIYKLFSEWERDGYVVPEMHPSANAQPQQGDANAAVPVVPKEPKKPPVRAELPPNWQTMHPATLLCIMRPGIAYEDYGTAGDKPNVPQCLGVIVDNQEFTANGRSKKIARRNVAVNVCNTLFGTNFTYEEY
ncbi:GL13431 [Drosophila persimilis]|uniref:GL13431 n=1 Tax=Drosophila persimilis TaxID=7234 RepID=B4H302_DROPE|nr:uncharacterized protein LOC6600107 [Drosophila persimilis]XP_026846681.1 uncharacterized protein LOC6600107 [Drosophila persimilis]EDW30834.1 GL13431 [Drosophila persimilis]